MFSSYVVFSYVCRIYYGRIVSCIVFDVIEFG